MDQTFTKKSCEAPDEYYYLKQCRNSRPHDTAMITRQEYDLEKNYLSPLDHRSVSSDITPDIIQAHGDRSMSITNFPTIQGEEESIGRRLRRISDEFHLSYAPKEGRHPSFSCSNLKRTLDGLDVFTDKKSTCTTPCSLPDSSSDIKDYLNYQDSSFDQLTLTADVITNRLPNISMIGLCELSDVPQDSKHGNTVTRKENRNVESGFEELPEQICESYQLIYKSNSPNDNKDTKRACTMEIKDLYSSQKSISDSDDDLNYPKKVQQLIQNEVEINDNSFDQPTLTADVITNNLPKFSMLGLCEFSDVLQESKHGNTAIRKENRDAAFQELPKLNKICQIYESCQLIDKSNSPNDNTDKVKPTPLTLERDHPLKVKKHKYEVGHAAIHATSEFTGRIEVLPKSSIGFQTLTNNGCNKRENIGHDCMTVEELTQLLRQNFALILDEINPLKLIPLMDMKKSSLNRLVSLIEEIGFRKKRALRFLLEILVHYPDLVPSLWDAMKIENKYCYKTVVSKKMSPCLQDTGQQLCNTCSNEAFSDFFSHLTSLPEVLLIHLLQIDILKPSQLLELHTCSENHNFLIRNIFASCNISWDRFIESLHVLSKRETSQLNNTIVKMAFVPCANCERAYEQLNIRKREICGPVDMTLDDNSTKSQHSSKIAVVSLDIDSGKENIVNTILRKKQHFNFKIKEYGKIKTAWCGSVVIVLELTKQHDSKIKNEDCILKIVRKILEDEEIKQNLEENDISMKIIVSNFDDHDNIAEDLMTQKILILENFTLFMEDLNVKDFVMSFSDHGIMTEEDFRTLFPFDDIRRKQCTKLFLEYILQLQSHQGKVLQAFFEVIDDSYKCLSKEIKGSYRNAEAKSNLIKDTVLNAIAKEDENESKESQENCQVHDSKGKQRNLTNRSEVPTSKMHTLNKEIHDPVNTNEMYSHIPVFSSPNCKESSGILETSCNSTQSSTQDKLILSYDFDKVQIPLHSMFNTNQDKEDIDQNDDAESNKNIHKIDEQKESYAKRLECGQNGMVANRIPRNIGLIQGNDDTPTNEMYTADLCPLYPFSAEMHLSRDRLSLNRFEINNIKKTYVYNTTSNTVNDINTKFTQIGSNNNIDTAIRGSDLSQHS